MKDTDSIAIVTKSYAADFQDCKKLCDSVDRRISPSIRHDLIVDDWDYDLFLPLQSERRRVLRTHSIPWLFGVKIGQNRFWVSPTLRVVRGWVQQQLAKMSHVASLTDSVVVLIDSDAVFVKDLDKEALLDGDRVRLLRMPVESQPTTNHRRWHRVAAHVLGISIPQRGHFGADYIAQVVTWRPETVRALIARIGRNKLLPWYLSDDLIRDFSEYVLYGIFAETDDTQRERHFLRDIDLCLSIWNDAQLARAGQPDWAKKNIRDHHVAAHIQSTLDINRKEREKVLNAITGSAR